MSNRDTKIRLINALLSRNVFIRKVNDVEYQTRCPYCGDTQKNFNDGHLYIKINPNDNLPIVYNCFKCPAHGVLKYDDLVVTFKIDNSSTLFDSILPYS